MIKADVEVFDRLMATYGLPKILMKKRQCVARQFKLY